MKVKSVLFFTLVILFCYPLWSQAVLPVIKAEPVQNGEIANGEYPYSKTVSGSTFSGGLSGDGTYLYLAASAKTSGWIALGLGSPFMDSSKIFMGFDAGGKPEISEQSGMGHSHSPISSVHVISWSVKETNGITVMELKLLAASYLKGPKLSIILGYGPKDDFTSRHNSRGMLEVTVQ